LGVVLEFLAKGEVVDRFRNLLCPNRKFLFSLEFVGYF